MKEGDRPEKHRLTRLEEQQDQIEQRIESLANVVNGHERRIARVEKRLAKHGDEK